MRYWRTLRTPRFSALAALGALLLLVGQSTAARAQDTPAILNFAPDDSQVLIVLPNFTQTSDQLAMLNSKLGLGIAGLTDAVGEFKRSIGLTKGLDETGGLLVAIADPFQANETGGLNFVIAIATNDYSGFVTSFGGRSLEPVTRITLPTGQIGYARNLGTHVLIGPTQKAVETHSGKNNTNRFAQRIGALGRQQLASSEATLILDAKVVRRLLTPVEVKPGKQQAVQPGSSLPGSGYMLEYGAHAIDLSDDLDLLIIGAGLREEGLRCTFVNQFKEASPLAKRYTQASGARELLSKLPQRRFMLAHAQTGSALREQLLQSFKDPQITPTWLQPSLDGLSKLLAKTDGVAVLLVEPQAVGLSTRLLNAICIIQTDNAAGFVEGFQAWVKSLSGSKFSIDMRPESEKNNPFAATNYPAIEMSLLTQYQANALQVKEGKVDLYEIAYNIPPQLSSQLDQKGNVLLTLIAGTGQKGYISAQGKYVLLSTAPDDQLLRDTLDALAGTTPLSEHLGVLEAQVGLPESSAGETFVSVTGWGNVVMRLHALIEGGQPQLVPWSDNLPPLGLGMASGDGGLAKTVFVPMGLIQPGLDGLYQIHAVLFPAAEGAGDGQPQQPQGPQPGAFPGPNPGPGAPPF